MWEGEWDTTEVPEDEVNAVNRETAFGESRQKLLPHQGGRVTSDWRPKVTKRGLGTFMGVFVPCMLSIIGLVLFLRLGWAVGQAGVMGTIGMFAIGGLMAVLTDLSLSAMATNGRVAGGGTYYLLSRSVGPELGGAIGAVFAAANVCGVSFYLQGFCEAMGFMIGKESHAFKLLLGGGLLLVEAPLLVFSSGLYSKCAFAILCIQLGAQLFGNTALLFQTPFSWTAKSDANHQEMVMNFTGPSLDTLRDNLWPDFEGSDFRTVFGIVFPAMTGIMAGTNMSGVLRRPELAIPRGELSAIFTALLLYMVMIICLGASVPRETLKNDYLILSKVTWLPDLVIIGAAVSTASSALASIQSAARLIQAIAQDDLFPILRVFRHMINGEPTLAIISTVVLSFVLLSLGSLDSIAPVFTMFMLITYAATNFATLVYTVAGHPNFRPRFRFFSWYTALLGGMLCLGLMVYIQWISTLIAFFVLLCISAYVSRRVNKGEGAKDWGDVTQALIFHQVRKYLLRLHPTQHVKFWRARFLLLAHSPQNKVNLFDFMNNLKKGGLFILGDVVVQPVEAFGPTLLSQMSQRRAMWAEFIKEAKLKAFQESILAPTFRHGVSNLMMLAGMGGMKPNTVALGMPGDDSTAEFQEELNAVYDASSPSHSKVVPSARLFGKDAPLTNPTPVSNTEFVSVLRDAIGLDMNLVLHRNFSQLNMSRIDQSSLASKRMKKFKCCPCISIDQEDLSHRSSRPAVEKKQRIDIWECPWGSPADLAFALQLADMLWRQDVWSRNTHLRVCSHVPSDDDNLLNTRAKYADLHHRVIRKMRIPATIQVWILENEQPISWQNLASAASDATKVLASWEACVAAGISIISCGAMAAQRTSVKSPKWAEGSGATENVLLGGVQSIISHMPTAVQIELMHELILQQCHGAAVTLIPLPPVPTGGHTPVIADEYIRILRLITEGVGPVLAVSAVGDVMAFEL